MLFFRTIRQPRGVGGGNSSRLSRVSAPAMELRCFSYSSVYELPAKLTSLDVGRSSVCLLLSYPCVEVSRTEVFRSVYQKRLPVLF